MKKFDFSGWATRNNLKCSDGRTILRDAFRGNDGQTVPLVWNHQHNDPYNVLGHALLENRDEGVYAYCSFNDTQAGKDAKTIVQHGDVVALSIYANQLRQKGGDVIHGSIREVSLVLAGANPGAFIDTVIAHSDSNDEEAVIYTGEPIAHSDDKPEKESKEEEEVVDNEKGKTIREIFDSMSEEQKNVVYAMVGQAREDALNENDDDDNDEEEEVEMKHNIFSDGLEDQGNTLSHAAIETIMKDAKRLGSLRDSVLEHSATYGIENIEWLFPEYQNVQNGAPGFINNEPQDWVKVVMNGVHHTPFSRIKSLFADIREDEARAKGYIKGRRKKEEVFTLLKRTTDPQTIYKKQKLDRDDVIDITDFDVVSWIKGEMRLKLDEELARAILVGDGRLGSDDDKILETHIRPIINDDALYTIKRTVTPGSNEALAHAIIDAAIRARSQYQGSGNPIFFTTETILADMLLLEDKMGRRIYDNVTTLATTLRVKEIVTIPYMPVGTYAIIVNLQDYNVGADKGGAINMFDDFDIDYNQMKYLIETRCSGALVRPFSAIVLNAPAQQQAGGNDSGEDEGDDNGEENNG